MPKRHASGMAVALGLAVLSGACDSAPPVPADMVRISVRLVHADTGEPAEIEDRGMEPSPLLEVRWPGRDNLVGPGDDGRYEYLVPRGVITLGLVNTALTLVDTEVDLSDARGGTTREMDVQVR